MKISTKGRYALRFMIDLAQNNTGVPVSLKDVAVRQGISDKYLEQIISEIKLVLLKAYVGHRAATCFVGVRKSTP